MFVLDVSLISHLILYEGRVAENAIPKYASLDKDYFEMQEKLSKRSRSNPFIRDIYLYSGNLHF